MLLLLFPGRAPHALAPPLPAPCPGGHDPQAPLSCEHEMQHCTAQHSTAHVHACCWTQAWDAALQHTNAQHNGSTRIPDAVQILREGPAALHTGACGKLILLHPAPKYSTAQWHKQHKCILLFSLQVISPCLVHAPHQHEHQHQRHLSRGGIIAA